MSKIKNQNNTKLAWNIRPLCPHRLPFRCVKLLWIFYVCKIKNQNNTKLAWNIRPLHPLRLPFRCVKLLQIFHMRKNSNWPISNQNCLHNIAFPKFLIWMKSPFPQASSHTEQYFDNVFLTSFVRWCVYIVYIGVGKIMSHWSPILSDN